MRVKVGTYTLEVETYNLANVCARMHPGNHPYMNQWLHILCSFKVSALKVCTLILCSSIHGCQV